MEKELWGRNSLGTFWLMKKNQKQYNHRRIIIQEVYGTNEKYQSVSQFEDNSICVVVGSILHIWLLEFSYSSSMPNSISRYIDTPRFPVYVKIFASLGWVHAFCSFINGFLFLFFRFSSRWQVSYHFACVWSYFTFLKFRMIISYKRFESNQFFNMNYKILLTLIC